MIETKQEEEVMEIAYKVCLDIVWECLNVEVDYRILMSSHESIFAYSFWTPHILD